MAVRLILLRHTTPKVAPGTCYGRTDLDVAETFEAEANAVLAALPPVARIVTSPLRRCRLLAAFIAERRGMAPEADPRLQEMDFGQWEGRPWSGLPRAELDAWAADFLGARPHGGESVAQLRARVAEALAEHGRAAEAEDGAGATLIVTHSGVIRAALARGNAASDFDADTPFGGRVALTAPHLGRLAERAAPRD